MLGLVLQDQNLDSGLEWLHPATAALKRHSLPKGVPVEESHHPCGVMR